MYRLLVALLAAVDALVAAAVGITVILAPLTLLWVFGIGEPDWGSLWPTAANVWQLGHAVPLAVTLPAEYLAATGISADAASFTVSLAPLAFGAFTAIFAARSGRRAARAGASITGVLVGTAAFAAIAAGIAITSVTPTISAELWPAIGFPALFYLVPSLCGAIVAGWTDNDAGVIDRVRERVEALPDIWALVPGLVVRGTAIVVMGLVGLGAAALVVAVIVRGPQMLSLYQAGNFDAIGATVFALGQLAYLPTLVIWALAFVAGPGFAVGTGTAVSPAGTQLGAVPGIPVLGLLPEQTSSWLLLLALLPVAVGAFAGWVVRSRVVAATPKAGGEPVGPMLALTAAITALSASVVALGAVLASGAFGPGRLADIGPAAGAIAITVGVEVAVGCGILLLSPRPRARTPSLPETGGNGWTARPSEVSPFWRDNVPFDGATFRADDAHTELAPEAEQDASGPKPPEDTPPSEPGSSDATPTADADEAKPLSPLD
ncbi:hypothetical protein FHX48_002637 [Microbacterium halimionae]|uniref:Uncharacterized protein n=1 Tax=Microbacterium halimionae TaxID=1526413 RepID=A0A7W3JR67_9MICO|nr:DUF6350 family protein [Microbacterium halimionae]MBA8817532.1 hypothetical protein [Microbacterium halimionae]NII95025.1 hypothetical protein [Microbacterium halimionae]